MNKIAAIIPGLQNVFDCNPVNPKSCASPIPRAPGTPTFSNLSDFLSPLLNIVLYIAAFFAFYWLIWGAFQYILAQGKKEELGKARARITWALAGLLVIFLAFFLAKFAAEIFPPTKGGLPF